MSLWPFRRQGDGKKGISTPSYARELRIATNCSQSMRASVESLRVDGSGSYAQSGRVRAAVFVPATSTTIQFHAEIHKKQGLGSRASCVHALQMFTPEETNVILDDAKRIGGSIGWSDRGVSLPTQDVLVQNLSKESQESVHKAIREKLLPFARRHFPHLNAAFDKQPYPRPGNLFIVRYCAASQRPGGRGLKLHKDETALTFNLCLSAEDDFTGGGTYFPAASADVDGVLVRPLPGYCLIHDGNIKHAGNEVRSGERFILVGFYNADGRDRAGEEQYFGKKAKEEGRLRLPSPPPVQTIYFTTAVPANRAIGGADGAGGKQEPLRPTEAQIDDDAATTSLGAAGAAQGPDSETRLLDSRSSRDGLSPEAEDEATGGASACAAATIEPEAAAATAEAAPKADAEVLLPPVGEGSLASSDANWDMKNCSSRPRRHKQQQQQGASHAALSGSESASSTPKPSHAPSRFPAAAKGQYALASSRNTHKATCMPNWMLSIQSRLRPMNAAGK